MKNFLFTIVLMLALSLDVAAQNQLSVRGTVKDQTGELLPGVNVFNITTSMGTITDIDGKYVLKAAKGNILRFSYIGMKEYSVKITSEEINVVMKEDFNLLDDVVVIGYGTSKKKDLTGAIASIKLEDSPTMQMPNTNILENLKGQLPGVNIGMTSSAGSTPGFSIRGQNSIKAGTSPLVVVDGIIGGSFSELNPQDIASVDILKDASSAAVYGSRAANGVILITTKRGKTQRPQFNFNMNIGVQNWTRRPDLMNGTQSNQFAIDKAIDLGYVGGDLELENLLRPKEYAAYKAGSEINWLDETTRSALIQNYQLSVSGASDRFNYYISGNYMNQEGLMIGDDFSRISLLAKLEAKLNKYVKMGINVSGTYRDYSGTGPSMYKATYITPWGFRNSTFENYSHWMERYPGGNTSWENPLWNAFGVDDKDIRYNASLKSFLEIRLPWIEGLTWKLNGAYNIGTTQQARFAHEEHYVNTLKEADMANPTQFLFNANGYSKDSNTRSWLVNQILNYSRNFGEHKIDLTFMSERQRGHSYGLNASARDFTQAGTTILGYNALEMGNKDMRGVDTWKSYHSALAYMVRANYVWKSRYHASASFRRDGSSVFADGHKYGNFAAAAVAWTISEEDFFKDITFLNYLKLRLSYGENGNPSIDSFQTFARVGMSDYIFGSETIKTMYQSSLGNKKLSWERTKSFNIGIDFGFFNDRLTGNIEYYKSKTNDLLVSRRLPITSGYGSILDNMGQVGNYGLEFGLHSRNIKTRNFSWNTDLSYWMNRNKIISLYGLDVDGDGREDDDLSNGWFVGKSLGAIYNYKTIGIVQKDDTEYMEKYNMSPGDVKIEDLNNDGKITPDDKTILGYSKPNFTMNMRNTITYKNFSLSFSLDWLAGGGKNNYLLTENSKGMNPGHMGANVWLADKQYWTPEHPVNDVPRPSYTNEYKHGFYQSREFLRLQDLTLSYSFGKDFLNKLKVASSAKLFVSGKNLLTFTKWDGLDPEAAQKIGEGAPSFKTFSFGMNISF